MTNEEFKELEKRLDGLTLNEKFDEIIRFEKNRCLPKVRKMTQDEIAILLKEVTKNVRINEMKLNLIELVWNLPGIREKFKRMWNDVLLNQCSLYGLAHACYKVYMEKESQRDILTGRRRQND